MFLNMNRFLPFDVSSNSHYLKILGGKCANVFSVLAWLTVLLLTFLFLASFTVKSLDYVQILYIEPDKPPIFTTDKRFLSIALDSSVIANGLKLLNFSNEKMYKVFGHLQPGYFRIGGTMADRLHFVRLHRNKRFKNYDYEVDGGACAYDMYYCEYENKENFTMSGLEWLKLNRLANRSNLNIIFDLNSLIRFENGSWDSRNAEELIKYSDNHGLDLNWELGNEPNAFKHQFDYPVDALQMGEDFKTLRNILNKYDRYKESLLVGPDVTRPDPEHRESEIYLMDFLKEGGQTVNAITWHQYYMNGRIATANDFISPEIFQLLEYQINIVRQIRDYLHFKDTPVWLGETSSAYGGGAPGYSDRFIASFLWADKLGLSAKLGISVVIRQSILNGYYALLDRNYDPNPDFWISILYKRLIDRNVVQSFSATSEFIRLYTFCTPKNMNPSNKSTAITVLGLNIGSSKAKIRIQGLPNEYNPKKNFIYVYELSSDENLISKNVYLNEELLKLDENNDLPNFNAKIVSQTPFILIKPYTIVFWIIPNVNIKACESTVY